MGKSVNGKFGVLTVSKEKLKELANQSKLNPNETPMKSKSASLLDSDPSSSDKAASTKTVTATTSGGPASRTRVN